MLSRRINPAAPYDAVARESAAREDLTELRISHERLQQKFRDKTAAALEKQSKAEAALMEERHKAEMANKAAQDRIGKLDRAQVEAAHHIRRLTESLERQKQETYHLYTNYAQVASQLEDTKTALEREQEEIVRMHQSLAQQKSAIASAAGSGYGMGGHGGMATGNRMFGGGGMGLRAQQHQQRPENLALSEIASFTAGGGAMGGGGVGRPPLYPSARAGQGNSHDYNGGLPAPESLLPSCMGMDFSAESSSETSPQSSELALSSELASRG